MTNLAAMDQRMQQWQAEKPGFDGVELKLYQNDVVIAHFVATGDDGDTFIKLYRSHVFPQFGKNGNRFNAHRYCTQQNEGTECVFCAQGHAEIKERMSMWFKVYNILHAVQPQGKTFPQVMYEGRPYYNEEVNGFKRWDDSAWRESPWADIIRFYGMYQSLHNFIATMICTGQGMQKRYKIYPLPNSAALPVEVYQQAQQECTPILQTLRAQQQQLVQINPQPQQTQALMPNGLPAPAYGAVAAFSVPGMPAPPPLPMPGLGQAWPAPAPQGMPAQVQFQAPAPQPMVAVAPQPTTYVAAPPPSAVAVRPDLGLPPPAPAPMGFPPPPAPVAYAPQQFQMPGTPASVPTMAEVPVSHPNTPAFPPIQNSGGIMAPPPVAPSGMQINAGQEAPAQQDDGAVAPRMF